MTTKEKLQEIFQDVFDDDSIELFDEMTAADVEDWDSLSHITLINEIERSFGIRFSTKEVLQAKNVGEFLAIIEKRLNQ
ncbi:acyl carrier protein [Selenomonas montiformis]|uniref:acyl carrier protein n=1 Tax=Selenomonas montiformis TaxID=2652285 RepID=UPI0039F595F7